MGLRERNALHTRSWIADSALDLFEQRGYDATTLEEVAARAEVSVSTLYRYFPTKDSLLVDHPALEIGALARALRGRPASEPVSKALGAAVLTFLGEADASREIIGRLRAVIDVVPVARARMWDTTHRESALLAEAVRERLGADSAAEEGILAAELALAVVVLALQYGSDDPGSARARGERVLELLDRPGVVERIVPRP